MPRSNASPLLAPVPDAQIAAGLGEGVRGAAVPGVVPAGRGRWASRPWWSRR